MKKNKGFTLIELLVVISIIALLLSILMPSLSKVKEQAKQLICSTRQRQLIMAATLYSCDDSKGRLPQGGIHGPWSGMEFDFDDAISMDIENYFKIGSYVAEIGGADFDPPTDEATMEQYLPLLHEGTLAKLFLCPNLSKLKDFVAFTGKNTGFPFVHGWGVSPERWTVRLGFAYMGGFETDKWGEFPFQNYSEPYKSPDKLSDPGNLVLMADFNRWSLESGGEFLTLPHGGSGYLSINELVYEPLEEYANAKSIVGYVDGSVENKRLSDCEARVQLKYDGGLVWTQHFVFF
jgi:prepilin-type N-terminal cleavage/methylation domain-containing protein